MDAWNIRALQEKRYKIVTDMKQLLNETGGQFSAEQRQVWERMDAEQTDLEKTINDAKRASDTLRILETLKEDDIRDTHQPNLRTAPKGYLTPKERDLALRAMLLGNKAPNEMRAAAAKANISLTEGGFKLRRADLPFAPRTAQQVYDAYKLIAEQRATSNALSAGTSAEGKDLVANNLMQAVEVYLLAFGGMRQAATIIRSARGATMPIPIWNDASNAGARIAENTATTVLTPVTAQMTLVAKTYTSRLVPVSNEFLQDASMDVSMLLGEAIGTRIGRIQNQEFTIGASSDGAPLGVVDPSTNSSLVGVTSSTYKTDVPKYSETIDLIHSVNPAYRNGPQEYLMFTDATLSRLKQLVDSQNRPLWLPSMRDGEPATIFGKRYIINQSMASVSTTSGSQKIMVFGDFSRYVILDALDIEVRVLRERYAELNQTAWLGYARADGTVTNRNALKHYLTGTT